MATFPSIAGSAGIHHQELVFEYKPMSFVLSFRAASADRNLEQLQELYEKYKDQGFMILVRKPRLLRVFPHNCTQHS
jgi:hypothetical protein